MVNIVMMVLMIRIASHESSVSSGENIGSRMLSNAIIPLTKSGALFKGVGNVFIGSAAIRVCRKIVFDS